MKKLLFGLVLACAVAATAVAAGPAASASAAPAASAPAASMQETAAASAPKAIPFKKEETSTGAAAGQSILILAVLLGLAWCGLVLAKRYMPQLRFNLPLQPNAQRRLKLIETMRLGPKATLYLVQLDGKTLLLAQSGEHITVADADRAGGINNNKDDDVAKPL